MRTTVTFDPDVAAQIEQLRAGDDRPFKELVNELLRAGLADRDRRAPRRRAPYTKVVDLGELLIPDITDVSAAIAWAEGEDHK